MLSPLISARSSRFSSFQKHSVISPPLRFLYGVAVGVVAVRPAANLTGGMGLAALIQEGKVVDQIAAGCRAGLPDHVADAVRGDK